MKGVNVILPLELWRVNREGRVHQSCWWFPLNGVWWAWIISVVLNRWYPHPLEVLIMAAKRLIF